MVSRRNFFTMLTLLMIMIFMFMFSSVLKQVLNEYDTNSHAEENHDERVLKGRYDDLTEKLTAQAKSLSYEVITQGDYEECDRDKRVIFLSKKIRSEVADVVASWCRSGQASRGDHCGRAKCFLGEGHRHFAEFREGRRLRDLCPHAKPQGHSGS